MSLYVASSFGDENQVTPPGALALRRVGRRATAQLPLSGAVPKAAQDWFEGLLHEAKPHGVLTLYVHGGLTAKENKLNKHLEGLHQRKPRPWLGFAWPSPAAPTPQKYLDMHLQLEARLPHFLRLTRVLDQMRDAHAPTLELRFLTQSFGANFIRLAAEGGAAPLSGFAHGVLAAADVLGTSNGVSPGADSWLSAQKLGTSGPPVTAWCPTDKVLAVTAGYAPAGPRLGRGAPHAGVLGFEQAEVPGFIDHTYVWNPQVPLAQALLERL